MSEKTAVEFPFSVRMLMLPDDEQTWSKSVSYETRVLNNPREVRDAIHETHRTATTLERARATAG